MRPPLFFGTLLAMSTQSRHGDRLHERRTRMDTMRAELKRLFPDASIALHFETNWQLYVAVVLSAQCTDKRVNAVTKELFKKYPHLEDYVHADFDEFANDIRSTGFFRNKARNILNAAQQVYYEYGGELPQSMDALTKLPGIGRKTANVILGNAYDIVDGIAVDTHVRRFALKFDLTDHDDPVGIEYDLMELIPKEEWFSFTYRIIEYGRQICPARKHDCKEHPLSKLYPPAAHTWPKAG